jgi:hypothetical protein
MRKFINRYRGGLKRKINPHLIWVTDTQSAQFTSSLKELNRVLDVYLNSAIAQRYVRSPSYERTTIRKPHPDHTFDPGSYLPGLFFAPKLVTLTHFNSVKDEPFAAYLLERFKPLAVQDR